MHPLQSLYAEGCGQGQPLQEQLPRAVLNLTKVFLGGCLNSDMQWWQSTAVLRAMSRRVRTARAARHRYWDKCLVVARGYTKRVLPWKAVHVPKGR